MKKTLLNKIKRKVSALLVCSMLMTQMSAASPSFAETGGREPEADSADTVTLRGTIVSLIDDWDVTKDVDLRLYVNGRLDKSRKPVFVRSEDSREPFDMYDDSFDLINDLDGGEGETTLASASNADYQVWEYRFENLPFEDEDGNEYEYTIRDLSGGPASPSNMASGSNLATDSRAGKTDEALYLTNMEGTEVLEVGGTEFPAAGARLVYVPYTDVEGAYVFTDASAGAERDPEQITLDLSCVREIDEEFLDSCGDPTLGAERNGDVEVVLDAENGRWSAERVPQYNPLTCEVIDYRVEAVSGYEDYRIRYENRGRFAGQEDYAYAGGTIYHETLAAMMGTYSVRGVITWNDRTNIWGLRPESANFLRIYDANGEDVSAQVNILAENTDTDTWNYTIEGLTAGTSYRLRQNLPAYDAENLSDITLTAEMKDAVAEMPAVEETLRTGTVRGLIHWSNHNPVVKDVDSLDFLHVYAGNEEVTGRVTLELSSSDGIPETGTGAYWAYTVDGLPEGRNYTIRADKPEGYAVIPSEISVTAGMNRYLRSRLDAGMPEMFTMRSVEPVKLTIKNVYHDGGTTGEKATFDYELKVGDNRDSLQLYGSDNGVISLSEKEERVIELTTGQFYQLKQLNTSPGESQALLYGGETARTKTGQISTNKTETFTNIKYQLKQYKKRWNDNGSQNGTTGRPTTDELKGKLKMTVKKQGGVSLTADEISKLGLFNPTITINETEIGANEWGIAYEKMPITDGSGTLLVYDVTEEAMDGYKTSYEDTDSNYDKVIVNTSYMTFEATKYWLDWKNESMRFSKVADYKNHLNLYRVDPVTSEATIVDFDKNNENLITVEGEDESLFWKITIENLVEYNESGLPYTYYLQEKTDRVDGTINAEEGSDAWYVPTCVNDVNYFNEKDKCYDEGVITNRLEGNTKVSFEKYWKDGEASLDQTPTVTFQLMRYPKSLDPKEGYAQASSVDTKTAQQLGFTDTKIEGKITWKDAEGEDQIFPRFDANGEEYVYFIRELLSGENSGEYVQKITATKAGGDSFFEKSGLKLIANGEVVTNKREGKVSIPVTKTWKSAAYQNIDAKVELKVERRSNNPAHLGDGWIAMAPDYFQGKTEPIITGFSAETLTMGTIVDNLFKYDDDGYLYEYRVLEDRVWLRTDKTKTKYPGDEAAQYIELVQAKDDKGTIYKTTQDHFDGKIQYLFRSGVTEPTKDDPNWQLTNTLENNIEIRVDKYWEGDWTDKTCPTELTFKLFRDDKPDTALATSTLKGDQITPLVTDRIQKLEFFNTDSKNIWPRYDENGKEYVYTVKETVVEAGTVGRITYKYEWVLGDWETNSDKNIDVRKVTVSNPPPGSGVGIEVEKIWLDGGDLPHRKNVEIYLYKKVNGTWKKTNDHIVLTAEHGWKDVIPVTDEITAEELKKSDAYMVVETDLQETAGGKCEVTYGSGEDFIKKDADGKLTAAGTTETENHTYNVTNSYNPATGYCTITNLRTGVVDVTVTKEWKDGVAEDEGTTGADVTNGLRPANATFELRQNGNKYEKADSSDTNPQTTATNKSQSKGDSDPQIKWMNLPKYDGLGELYAYTVKETKIGNADASSGAADFAVSGTDTTHRYTSSIEAEPYQHGNADIGNDKIKFHAVNKRSDVRTIRIYKYWKDDGSNTSPRADVYFSLMRSIDGGKTLLPAAEAGKAIKNENYTPPQGHEGEADNWFEFVFDSAPRYDGDGMEYTYYLKEGMNGNSSKYVPYYYAEKPEKITDTTETLSPVGSDDDSWYPMPNDTGTVVNIREDTVEVKGKKIWENMGGLKQSEGDFPTLTLTLRVKPLNDSNAKYENVIKPNSEDPSAQDTYTCTLPDVSGNYEYGFAGPNDGQFPKYDERTGQELAYFVAETSDDGEIENLYERTSDERSFVIKNTYKGETNYKVELTKTWGDVPNDKEGPTIKVELWRVMTKLGGDDGKTKEPILYTAERVGNPKTVKYSEADPTTHKEVITFDGLAKTAPTMQPYLYYVKETVLNGYESSLTELDNNMWVSKDEERFELTDTETKRGITNIYKPEKDEVNEIKGKKVWSFTANQDALIPANKDGITLKLYSRYINSETNQKVDEEVDANFTWKDSAVYAESDAWEFTFTPKDPAKGFPKYAPNGTEYFYFVRETITDENLQKLFGINPVDSIALKASVVNGGNNLLTVTNKLQTVELKATKKWEDSKNLYGTRPNEIVLTVQRAEKDGGTWADYTVAKNVVTLKLTKAGAVNDSWNASMKDLPQYGYNGLGAVVEYKYRAVEKTANVPNGYTHDEDKDVHNAETTLYTSEITNTVVVVDGQTTSIIAKKIWDDEDDKDGFRKQTTVDAQLWRKRTGAEQKDEMLDSVELLASPTNAQLKPKDDVTRSDNVVTWSKLPKYVPGSTTVAAEYYIKESMTDTGAAFYSSSVAQDESNTTVWNMTNTHQQITNIEVKFTKEWDDQNNIWSTRPREISVVLLRKAGADGKEEVAYNVPEEGDPAPQTAIISAPADNTGNWEATFKNLPYASNGEPYTYYVKEGTVENGKFEPGKVNGYKELKEADITKYTPVPTTSLDSHKGSVSVINHLDTTSIQAEKTWADSDNIYETRPNSVTFKLYRKSGADGYVEVEETDNLKNLAITITKQEFLDGAATVGSSTFKLKYNELPKADLDGNEYTYQIRETAMTFGSGNDAKTYDVTWNNAGTQAESPVGGYGITSAFASNATKPTQTITNTLVAAAPVRIEKEWNDKENQDGIRETNPSEITVKLYRTTDENETEVTNMVSVGEPKTLQAAANTGDPWYAEWAGLPLQDPAGKSYYYSAVETMNGSPYTATYKLKGDTGIGEVHLVVKPNPEKPGLTDDTVTVTVTNSYMPKTMQVTAKKVWSGDDDGSLSHRLEQITFGLYQKKDGDEGPSPVIGGDGKPVQDTVSATTDWETVWKDLPVCSGGGNLIEYYVKEESTISGYTSSYESISKTDGTDYKTVSVSGDIAADSNKDANAQTITVTNTWTERSIYAKKVWVDEDNRDGLRKDVTLRLLANGNAAQGQDDRVIAITSPNLMVSWNNLPVTDDSGQRIIYSVEEVDVPDKYTVTTSSNAEHNGADEKTPLLVTNTHEPEKTSYSIQKLWLGDEDWKEDVRPDSIQMQLYMIEVSDDHADGIEKTVDDPVTVRPDTDGRWIYTWTDLYKYQNEGREIHYYAKELDVDGYTSTASGSNAIANKMNTTSLEVTKEWDDGDDAYGRRPESITILLQRRLQNGASWETLPEAKAKFTMDSADGWGAVEFAGLPTHNKNGRPYEYRAIESEIGGEHVSGGKAAGYEAIYEHQPNVLTIPGETKITNRLVSGSLEVAKTLKNGAATEFSFQVELAADGRETITKEYTILSGESFRIDQIPAGVTYTVTELEKSGYTLESKTGDTGVIVADQTAKAEFVNRKKSSGGGSGGGNPPGPVTPTQPTNPVGPGVPTEPENPTNPENPTGPENPGTPGQPGLPEIPVTPEGKPDIPPGTIVDIHDPDTPDDPVYHGPYDPNRGFPDVPPGVYELITFDEHDVPLGRLMITIDDEGIPLALPKTGDTGIPVALLAAALIGSSAGVVLLRRRKEEDEE